MRLRIGTRGSALALAQSRSVAVELARRTGEEPELIVVRTSGDRFREAALPSFGGAGAFTREIDEGQRAGRFEVSVHSLKDLPAAGREGLRLAAIPPRAPVEDCLVARGGGDLASLPEAAVVGSSSPRRRAQLLRLRPDLSVVDIRGNVETRLRKVREGAAEATLLARAGLVRLGLEGAISEVLDVERMVPAAGQGALAIVVREGARDALDAVRTLDDPATRAEVVAERAVLAALGGGCHLPMGALGRVRDGRLRVVARVVSPDGRRTVEDSEEGAPEDAEAIGARVGARLLAAGAAALLPRA